MEWIDLAQDMEISVAERLAASQEGIGSTELVKLMITLYILKTKWGNVGIHS
jgi:hypothetical protein